MHQALKGDYTYTLAYERGTAGCISKMPLCDYTKEYIGWRLCEPQQG